MLLLLKWYVILIKFTNIVVALTRQAVDRRRGAACQGDISINIRMLATHALTLLCAVKTIDVATTTAICKLSTSARLGVVIPANETATTRSY